MAHPGGSARASSSAGTPGRRLGGGGCCLPAPLPVLTDPARASEGERGAQGTRSISLKSKSGHRPSPHGLGEVSPAAADVEKEAGSRVLAARRWRLAGDGHHRWVPRAPPPAGTGGLREGGQPREFSNLPEVTRQRGHSPSDTPVLVLPQPRDNGASLTSGAWQRTRPHFCCFFPQSWVEAARGQGPRSLLVQNPPEDREMTAGSCHRLPSPGRSLAEARASPGGGAPQGKRGRRCLPCAHRARGKKEGPFRTETTYHPRSPVTNQGKRGEKVQLLGPASRVVGCPPTAGVGQSPGPQHGAVGSGRDAPSATGCCTKETLLLCGSAFKKQVNAEGHLGEVGAVAWSPAGRVGRVCPSVGRRKGSLGQVFHRQLLLQVPVVGNRHILVGGGHQRDGSAVVLCLGGFLLHMHWMAAGREERSGPASPSRWTQPHDALGPNPLHPCAAPRRGHHSPREAKSSSQCPLCHRPSAPNPPATPAGIVPRPLTPGQADLYCCGDRRGLLLPLLLTCSTVLLTSSWPTCSMPLAELVLIMVGLLSSGKLLSASAACNGKQRRLKARRMQDHDGKRDRRAVKFSAPHPRQGRDRVLTW